MRVARVWHGKDGYTLAVDEVPGWAIVVDRLAGHACALTRHIFCHPREWMFKIGWDKDEDGHAEHSLGGFLWDISNKPLTLEIRKSTHLYERSLTDAEVAEHFPDSLMECLEDEDEGQRITDEINANPEEVASLRRSREQAREGKRVRWLRDDETLDEVINEDSTRD